MLPRSAKHPSLEMAHEDMASVWMYRIWRWILRVRVEEGLTFGSCTIVVKLRLIEDSAAVSEASLIERRAAE